MLQGEHSATLSTFIKLPFVIKIFVLSIFEWPFYTGFTTYTMNNCKPLNICGIGDFQRLASFHFGGFSIKRSSKLLYNSHIGNTF